MKTTYAVKPSWNQNFNWLSSQIRYVASRKTMFDNDLSLFDNYT